MRRSRRHMLAGLAVLGLAVCVVPDATSLRETLKAGFPSLTMSTILPHIAQDLGPFEREGVNASSPPLGAKGSRRRCQNGS